MRVLHVTPRPLPDIRVERSILSDEKYGHEVHVAAPGMGSILGISATFHELPFTPLDKAGIRLSRKRLERIVREVKPDVIHAHDFPAAFLAKGLAAMLYNSHEDRISTAKRRVRAKLSSLLGFSLGFLEILYEKKAIEAAEDVVVVCPSRPIAEVYLKHGARKAFVLPNFPHELEVPEIELGISEEKLHGALDKPKYLIHTHRFPRRMPIEGFPEKFSEGKYGKLLFAGGVLKVKNVISLGFIPHLELYKAFREVRTFIVHRKPHESHRMLSPNRVYTIAQVGAVPIIPYTLEQARELIPEAIEFRDSKEFREILGSIEDREERLSRKERVKERARKLRRLDEVQQEAYKYV